MRLVEGDVHVMPGCGLTHLPAHLVRPCRGVRQRLAGLKQFRHRGLGRWSQVLLGQTGDDPVPEPSPRPGGRCRLAGDHHEHNSHDATTLFFRNTHADLRLSPLTDGGRTSIISPVRPEPGISLNQHERVSSLEEPEVGELVDSIRSAEAFALKTDRAGITSTNTPLAACLGRRRRLVPGAT